jgi:hypothetical protein
MSVHTQFPTRFRAKKEDWMVSLHEFGWDQAAAREFMKSREKILKKARAAGIPRDVFLPFHPNKPGFEERAKVLTALPDVMSWK